MINFLKKFLVFILVTGFSICCVYYIKDKFINKMTDKSAIYLWGDSQLFLGIDPELLSELSGRPVYSMAHNGAGVYDFAVFAEKVPVNSTIAISISSMMLMKDLEGEFNRSGICFGALKTLGKNKYSFKDFFYLVNLNKKESSKYLSKHECLPYTDILIETEPFENFEKLFFKEYPENKAKAILSIIESLKKKNCEINFVSFPVHDKLRKLIFISPSNSYLNSFYSQIEQDTTINRMDFNSIKSEKNVMYDVNHFNSYGRLLATQLLKDLLIIKKHSN